MIRLRDLLKPLSVGFLGALLALAGWHLWMDHQTVDQVRQILAAQQAQQAPPQAKPQEPGK